MKPRNWDQLSIQDQHSHALALFKSERGRLMIGRALRIASQLLPDEPSDQEDMEALGKKLFPTGWSLQEAGLLGAPKLGGTTGKNNCLVYY